MNSAHKRMMSIACAATLVGGFLMSGSGSALAKGDPVGPNEDPKVMAQAAAEKPLDDIANALGEQGRGAYVDIYSNLRVDTPHNQVVLYVTDVTHAAAMVRAAHAAHPHIDITRISTIKAAYSKQVIDAQLQKIMAAAAVTSAADLTIYSAAAAPDGSGIQVTAKPDALPHAHALAATSSGGIPVTVTAGTPAKGATSSWRWNDAQPFIGGDVLVGKSRKPNFTNSCTSSIAAEDSAGRDYLITAAHCYGAGTSVTGNARAVGDINSVPAIGNSIGTVTSVSPQWDSELIDTGQYNGQGANSDEADAPVGRWIPVDAATYSYDGQDVCQDGARSFYTGHGVPCGIVVDNADITYNLTFDDGSVNTVRGVQGFVPNADGGWAVTAGDSGGLIFAIDSTNTRAARGVVSAESGNSTVYWTEAPDILSNFNLHLNPHQ